MSTATRIVIPNANHMWPGDDPQAFPSAIDRFITTRH
jgi:hypothetical protein